MNDFIKSFNQLIRPFKNKIMLMIGKGNIIDVKDDGDFQTSDLHLLKDELRSNVKNIKQYGFTNNPPAGSETLTLFVGGDRSNGVVIATEHKVFRFKNLKSGEVALYTNEGDHIYFKNGRTIDVKTENLNADVSKKAVITSPLITINGNTTINGDTVINGKTAINNILTTIGNITSGGSIIDFKGAIDELREIYNNHTHEDGEGRRTTTPDRKM